MKKYVHIVCKNEKVQSGCVWSPGLKKYLFELTREVCRKLRELEKKSDDALFV